MRGARDFPTQLNTTWNLRNQWPILRLNCAVSVGVMGVVGESKKSGAVGGTRTVGRWDIAGACRSQPCEEEKNENDPCPKADIAVVNHPTTHRSTH